MRKPAAPPKPTEASIEVGSMLTGLFDVQADIYLTGRFSHLQDKRLLTKYRLQEKPALISAKYQRDAW